jgi:hypothetical protein
MMTGFRAATAEVTRQEWRDIPQDVEVIHFRLPLDNHGIDDDFREAPQLINLGYMTAFETLNSLKRKSKKSRT